MNKALSPSSLNPMIPNSLEKGIQELARLRIKADEADRLRKEIAALKTTINN